MQKDKSGHFIWMAYFRCWNVVLQWSAWSRNLRERLTSASKIPSAMPSFAILLLSSSVKVRSDLQCLFCSHLLGQPSCQQCLLILSQMPVRRTSAVCLCVSGSPDTKVHGLPQCGLSEDDTSNPQSWIPFSAFCLLLINSKWFGLVHLLFIWDIQGLIQEIVQGGFYVNPSVYPCLCDSTNVPYSYSFIYHLWCVFQIWKVSQNKPLRKKVIQKLAVLIGVFSYFL